MTKVTTRTKPAGLTAIDAEMAPQFADALATYSGVEHAAREVADSLRQTQRLVLLGMGASHAANRKVEPL